MTEKQKEALPMLGLPGHYKRLLEEETSHRDGDSGGEGAYVRNVTRFVG
jgi:hypothetical protein